MAMKVANHDDSESSINRDNVLSRRGVLSSFLAGALATATSGIMTPNEAAAEGSRVIAQISGSGLVFKVRLFRARNVGWERR